MHFKDKTLLIAVFAVPFVVFILTMEPTVGLIDSGELSLACAEPGIAHPTGYPLYTIIGRLFVLLIPLEPIVATNLFSAFSGAIACLAIFLILRLVLQKIIPNGINFKRDIVALITAISFGFSESLWSVSNRTEVYSLEMAMAFLAFYFVLKWLFYGNEEYILLSVYILGLAFGVHMMTLLFAPAVLMILIARRKNLSPKIFFYGAILFILGLSVYLYLPIRASQNPLSNFGDPSNLERFFRHISAWQYRVWMFSRPAGRLILTLKDFGFSALSNMTVLALPFMLIGFIWIFKKSKITFFSLFLIFFLDVLYALNYDIPDIEAYFLPAMSVLALAFGVGVAYLVSLLKWRNYILIFSAIIPLALCAFNFRSMDRSDYRLAEETAKNLLVLSPQNAVVYVNNWDLYAPAVYLQRARGIRKDLTLLDFELMRRSWYLRQKIELLKPAKTEIEDFIASVMKFERGQNISDLTLETKWRAMHVAITKKNIAIGKPVCGTFYTGEMETLWRGLPMRSAGVAQRIAPEDYPVSYDPPERFDLRELAKMHGKLTRRERALIDVYLFSWNNYSQIYYINKMFEEALEYLRLSVKFFPEVWDNWRNIAVIYIEQERFEEAMDVFKNSERFAPEGTRFDMIYTDLERKIAEKRLNENW